MKKMPFTRELLYNRHRLSHPQIDGWIGKSDQTANLEEKLGEMARMAEFIAITDDFVAAGLDFVCFKGPLLSQRLYGDATYRRYRDFDFLFDIPTAEIAYKLLVKKGYIPDDYKIPDEEGSHKKQFFKHIRDISLYNSEKNICIEIHWKLFAGSFLPLEKLQRIISSNLSEISLAGRPFTVLNPELDLLYLVIHGGLHGFFRLKWLIDIKDFLEKVPVDLEKFQQLTNQLNASRMVALCNEVLIMYFPDSTVLPGKKSAHRNLLNYTIESIGGVNDELSLDFVKYYPFALAAFPGWRYKINYIHNMLFRSYVVHKKRNSFIPMAYILIVPFQTVIRWIKERNQSTAEI
jgi:hypothetical protein